MVFVNQKQEKMSFSTLKHLTASFLNELFSLCVLSSSSSSSSFFILFICLFRFFFLLSLSLCVWVCVWSFYFYLCNIVCFNGINDTGCQTPWLLLRNGMEIEMKWNGIECYRTNYERSLQNLTKISGNTETKNTKNKRIV